MTGSRPLAALLAALVLAVVPLHAQEAGPTLPQLSEAAESGSTDAQFALAKRYLDGDGVLQNHATAAQWLLEAAQAGDARAQNLLGQLYHTGLGVDRDVPTALDWLEKAAQSDNPQYLYDLASVLESPDGGADFSRAAALYTRAAEAGHLEATVSLGVLYQNGTGVEQDSARARVFYELAAESFHPRALNNLGLLFVRGEGVAQDYDRAAKLFAAAAEQGLRTAMTNLGVMYENGFGVPLDEARAAELYRMGGADAAAEPAAASYVYDPRLAPVDASKSGIAALEKSALAQDPVAQFQLAWLIVTSPDVPFSALQRAGQLFRAAARRGHGPSMANLGVMYFRGQGVPQDYLLGQVWLLLANRAGVDTTPISVGFSGKLTPDQSNQAQARALDLLDSLGLRDDKME